MALNPILFAVQMVPDFLHNELTTYPISESYLDAQMTTPTCRR